jgi:hypothetical protein
MRKQWIAIIHKEDVDLCPELDIANQGINIE